jgi:Sulfite exporter TauE/SafE
MAAGAINTLVGSGTLITFPVLLAFGYSPVTANVSNTIGLVPGSVSGAIGYRRELHGQARRAVRLGAMSLAGGITGAVALLILPAAAFEAIVPAFIAVALLLTLIQPRIARWLLRREIDLDHSRGVPLALALYVTGVYGGYFGAAQGIMLLAILGAEERPRRARERRVGLDLRVRCPRRMGAGRDHRCGFDRGCAAWSALRASPAGGCPARRDPGRRPVRDRASSHRLSVREAAGSQPALEPSVSPRELCQPTWPTPTRPLVATGTPLAQSISRDFLVLASVPRMVRTFRVAVSITSPESPT